MPSATTIQNWKDAHPEFLALSARARERSAELFIERRMEKANRLYDEAQRRLATGEAFPKGVVEAIKVSMQEDAREAAIRDDSRYGNRKSVKLEANVAVSDGMSGVYEAMRAALLEDEDDKDEG